MKPPNAAAVTEIVNAARPAFAGHNPGNQGAALGDLVAIWLAGYPPDLREPLLELHIEMVRRLIPVNARAMGTGE